MLWPTLKQVTQHLARVDLPLLCCVLQVLPVVAFPWQMWCWFSWLTIASCIRTGQATQNIPSKKRYVSFPLLAPTHPPQDRELRRHQLFANGVIPLQFKLFINMHIMTVKMKMLKLSWSYFPFTLYKGRYWNNLHQTLAPLYNSQSSTTSYIKFKLMHWNLSIALIFKSIFYRCI